MLNGSILNPCSRLAATREGRNRSTHAVNCSMPSSLSLSVPWAALPHDFPPYKTVQDYQRKLCRRGVWLRLVDGLRQQARQQAGRDPTPSVLVIDSQSVKTTEKGGLAALMGSSASRGVSASSSWIRRAGWCAWRFTRQIRPIAKGVVGCWRASRRCRA